MARTVIKASAAVTVLASLDDVPFREQCLGRYWFGGDLESSLRNRVYDAAPATLVAGAGGAGLVIGRNCIHTQAVERGPGWTGWADTGIDELESMTLVGIVCSGDFTNSSRRAHYVGNLLETGSGSTTASVAGISLRANSGGNRIEAMWDGLTAVSKGDTAANSDDKIAHVRKWAWICGRVGGPGFPTYYDDKTNLQSGMVTHNHTTRILNAASKLLLGAAAAGVGQASSNLASISIYRGIFSDASTDLLYRIDGGIAGRRGITV